MPRRQYSPTPVEMPNESLKGGIEVKVVDFDSGAQLAQIHSSKTILYDQVRANRHVVFATAGSKFAIEITARTTFEWGDANALEVTLGCDQGDLINEKRFYLVRQVPSLQTSSLAQDNALLDMLPSTHGLSCCIDQILIQQPEKCEGQVSPYWFIFAEPSDDGALQHQNPSRNPSVSPKISEHQGKIRVEVKRMLVRKGTQRYPGLYDSVLKVARASRQTMLDNGLDLEIGLVKVDKAGLMDYGSAFRPTACKEVTGASRHIFEFLYRSTRLIQEIVLPQYLHEISAHPDVCTLMDEEPEFGSAPYAPNNNQHGSAMNSRVMILQNDEIADNSIIFETRERSLSTPYSTTSQPYSIPSGAVPSSSVSSMVRSPNTSNSTNTFDTLSEAHETLISYGNWMKTQIEMDERLGTSILHHLRSISATRSRIGTDIGSGCTDLAQCKDWFRHSLDDSRRALEDESLRMEARRIMVEKMVRTATATFVSSLAEHSAGNATFGGYT